jgi:hypothetical protein
LAYCIELSGGEVIKVLCWLLVITACLASSIKQYDLVLTVVALVPALSWAISSLIRVTWYKLALAT